MRTITPVLSLSEVFPGHHAEVQYLEKYLSRVNRDNTLFLCAKLNLLVASARFQSTQQQADAQVKAVALLKADGFLNDDIVNRITAAHHKMLKEGGEYSFVISRPALLELLRWVSAFSSTQVNPGAHKRDHVQESFVKALLTCSDFFFARFDRYLPSNKEFTEATPAQQEQMRWEAQPVLRLMQEFGAGVNSNYALGRSRLLMKECFLDANPDFYEQFATTHDGLTFEDYSVCAAFVMLHGLFNPRFSFENLVSLHGACEFRPAELLAKHPSLQRACELFLNHKAQSPDELTKKLAMQTEKGPESFLDLKAVREKPVLHFDTGQTVIIDEKMFMDSLTVGPLFMLMTGDKETDRQTFAKFGMAVQRYAMRLLEVTNGVLPTNLRSNDPVWEAQCKIASSGPRSLADILLIKDEAALLIEAKGLWFNEAAIKGTAEKFWAEIERLYGISTDEKGEESRKGYAQLSDVIKLLSDDTAVGIDGAQPVNSSKEIFPILVVHDDLMLSPNLAYFLALRFARELGQQELPETGYFQFAKYKVHSLILLSVSDLESLQSYKLARSIAEYMDGYSGWDVSRSTRFTEFLKMLQLPIKEVGNDIVRTASTEYLNMVRARLSVT